MRRLVLINPVRIRGHDFFGRRAEVILEPADEPGWFWRIAGEDVPIGPGLVHAERRCLALRRGKHTLHVFEHLGALRATGLDQVRIVAATSWLPYDGRAAMYWSALAGSIAEDGRLKPMSRRVHECVSRNDGIPRRLAVNLGSAEALKVTVRVSYAKWGEYEITRTFPDEDAGSWKDIAAARPLARPSWLRGAARCAALLGWPHYDNVLWPQSVEPGTLLEELARHRILDLLGAIGTVPGPGEYLTGEIETDLADHAADVVLLQRLQAGNRSVPDAAR
jgi:UDP-3-O-acyl-N-acetylglucosamine deacetylase